MTLYLYNTLTRQKQAFQPLEASQVKVYCCGVTVYDYCHLGHARSYIVWDTLRRYLQWSGYGVRYVQNFTDIDDKILNRARTEGSTMEAVADRFTAAYFEDMARLNILAADSYPRATHTLDGIQRLIHELEQRGTAYPAGGDVYYAVESFPSYGKLSGRRLEDLQAGASGRTDTDADAPKKRNPFDFALWKGAKPDEPAWDSPWGPGRPGWHIECSAMVRQELGEAIDIHLGGADLIFPHHENEIAQSEAATGQSLAQFWLHNGMVNVGGEKMSKSLGNFTTIRQLLDQGGVNPMALRLFVLQAHYRKPLDFTEESIAAATSGWHTLREGLTFADRYGDTIGGVEPQTTLLAEPKAAFQRAMDDDLNTPVALAILFDLAKDLRRAGNLITHSGQSDRSPQVLAQTCFTLKELAQVLGLEAAADEEPAAPSAEGDELSDAAVEDLIAQRQAARASKNWAEADRLRDELQNHGITLIDQAGGTRWHRSQ
ncbi:MAG: cysteine--tRNA ligase [Prochlorotrichaceae cyanobacterium]